MSATVILAEDERLVRQALVRLLETAGYAVRAAKNGEEALNLYRERHPDLLLLDVMMPKANGYEVCETVRRADAETPVLFLTALDSDVDELKGLGVGADAHISKTVSNEVLLARIAAAVRRHRHDEPTGDFDIADWHVEPAQMTMRRKDGAAVRLHERDVALLRWFAGHPGEVFSRDFLFAKFWGYSFEGSDSTLSIAILRLREKLGEAAVGLQSVRGSGYVWRPQRSASSYEIADTLAAFATGENCLVSLAGAIGVLSVTIPKEAATSGLYYSFLISSDLGFSDPAETAHALADGLNDLTLPVAPAKDPAAPLFLKMKASLRRE